MSSDPDDKMNITAWEYETELGYWEGVGRSTGLRKASEMLMNAAKALFADNQDDEATILRKHSKKLQQVAQLEVEEADKKRAERQAQPTQEKPLE
jgi:hypothetical protein